MANVALKLSPSEPRYEVATVTAVADGEIKVRAPRGERRARRATSCLVAPGVGDEVSLMDTGDGRFFVIAVLVGSGEKEVEIAVEGDLRISATGTMSLASKILNLRAVESSVVLSKLTLMASSVLAHTDTVRFAAKALESFCDHVSQTAKLFQRTVEELDQLRAGSVDYRTDKEMYLRSENFLVGARNLAKLDAEQIHIG
jgi:hypothetical protein